ncbi:hypothetical protein QE380_000174 [Acinetobacter baylyi]|uniref:Colicin D immunity protein domain-containing protein n=1 Tax=Acinetobacter baylyi TaxID=202950 RepID=A0ABU0US13_ACIBI|nr:hypothetical protein [Acinetobacter baylyi]MDQ1207251.1 hypothetical protein [Acinetobacter baylyi]MDR6105668.1 hypothetical protein [Acinetobacter baylyi]MDR6187612.1 hypothetical protein [Acinetobacter baylyi]
MDKCREAFEKYIRSQSGFTSDFQIGCNGQYKSDLMHFMFVMWQEQQQKFDELQERVDAAIFLLPSIRDENDLWGCDQVDRQIELLEQALKGGEV